MVEPVTNRKVDPILNEIEFGPLQESDLAELSRLIVGMRPYAEEDVWLRSASEEYYHWMYFQNPAGRVISYAGRYRGGLVCSFSMVPKRAMLGGEEHIIGKTMDMFTHPDYQRKGLIKIVVNAVLEEARAAGIHMYYITPSVNSHPIFLKVWNCREPFTNQYVAKLLRPSPVCATLIRPAFLGWILASPLESLYKSLRLFTRLPRGYEIREEDFFGPETDALWQRSKGYPNAVIRDATYLNWRYVSNPDPYTILKFYKDQDLTGLLVLKNTKRKGLMVGEIVDFLCPPADEKVRLDMFLHGIDYLYQAGCTFAQSWAVEDTVQHRILRKAGLKIKRANLPILFSPEAPIEGYYDKASWLLTQGDGNDI